MFFHLTFPAVQPVHFVLKLIVIFNAKKSERSGLVAVLAEDCLCYKIKPKD